MTSSWWHTHAPFLFGNTVDWSRDFTIASLVQPSTRSGYITREFVDGLIPGHPFTVYDNTKKLERYLDFYGFDYGDILYPSQHSTGIGNLGVQQLNYVSSNLKKLYR